MGEKSPIGFSFSLLCAVFHCLKLHSSEASVPQKCQCTSTYLYLWKISHYFECQNTVSLTLIFFPLFMSCCHPRPLLPAQLLSLLADFNQSGEKRESKFSVQIVKDIEILWKSVASLSSWEKPKLAVGPCAKERWMGACSAPAQKGCLVVVPGCLSARAFFQGCGGWRDEWRAGWCCFEQQAVQWTFRSLFSLAAGRLDLTVLQHNWIKPWEEATTPSFFPCLSPTSASSLSVKHCYYPSSFLAR